jgi:hypothetical protein
MVAANFSKSHPQEEDVFIDSKALSDTPEGIPYRKLDKVSLFDENVVSPLFGLNDYVGRVG